MRYLKYLLIFVIAVNVFLSAWYVLHGDIYFNTDRGRDFLILQEISEKKVVLIGPRSSGEGLFHGPLWAYMNYPIFALSGGNPLASGYYWVGLGILFLLATFYFSKKLFDDETAYITTALVSTELVTHVWGMFHPDMAMFLTIPYFYFFMRFYSTKKLKYLLAHLLTAGFIFQFEVAPGLSVLVLSFVATVFLIIRNKQYKYLMSYLILAIPLATFMLFDVRHQFIQTKSVLMFGFGNETAKKISFLTMLNQRINLIFVQAPSFFKDSFKTIEYYFGRDWQRLNLIPLGFSVYYIFKSKMDKDKRFKIYAWFLYFYVGFFALTLLRNGIVLYFHWYALVPLIFMIFSSLSYTKSKIFYCLVILILAFGFYQNVTAAKNALTRIGKVEDSWKFEKTVEEKAFQLGGKDFGYLVFTPDVYAYEPKYAMIYGQKTHPMQKAEVAEKKNITIVILAPDDPKVTRDWWRKTKMGIITKPKEVVNMDYGYTIEKYDFKPSERGSITDPAIREPLFFR